jgi:hypothetical protein
MADNKKSVFNKLNDLLLFKGGFEGTFENKEEKIIIKGDSYEEVLRKQMELQQQEQLYSQFYKVEKNQLQKTMQYEAQRLPAFMDYEGMEYYPMIASALDLYAEEATTIGENGKMLNIYSKSDRVKKVLEDLFYDVLNVNTNLVSWTRTLCKMGDNFIYLLPEKGKGITMVKQLPVFEMERKEDVVNNKLKVWFKRRDTGQEYTPMEIAHFRLAGDDKYYPYGTSILNKGRRIWRQCLDENTEIWTPNGSKKIKDIEIGDIIYSFNIDNETFFESKVSNKSYNGIKERFLVKTSTKSIILTDDHLLLVNNEKGYEYKDIRSIVVDKDLLVGDKTNFEEIIEITSVGEGHVWDIEVDNEYHNFIAEGLVVHNCIMAEDAMLSYRILRAGEKRVFKIDVGNLDVNDIEGYIQKVATKFKRSPQINRDNGNLDHRFNILGNDEDYFIPVRNSNAGTVIDTLPGGESLDKIADIEYLRDNLFTSLGVPKPFLGYQSTAGEGKNLAQQDMRFSKKINRVQQSIVQELNKIAIIHLYLLGFEDELDNFSLSLSSPSNQAEILKVELLTLKMQLYNEMTAAQDNGIAAASHTWAKKNLLNWSEDEILKDFENQMMERVVVQELQNATNIFAKTGIFDNIINKYGAKEGEVPISAPTEENKMDDNEAFSMGSEPELPTPGAGPEAGGGGAPAPEMPAMGENIRYRNNKLIMEIMTSNVKDEDKENLLEEYKSTQDKSNKLFNKTLESIKEIENNLEKTTKKTKK